MRPDTVSDSGQRCSVVGCQCGLTSGGHSDVGGYMMGACGHVHGASPAVLSPPLTSTTHSTASAHGGAKEEQP